MGGEIVAGQPTGQGEGGGGARRWRRRSSSSRSTSRTSPYVIILDLQNPFTGAVRRASARWRGAYLQDLAEWRSQPGDLRVDGVIRDEHGHIAK